MIQDEHVLHSHKLLAVQNPAVLKHLVWIARLHESHSSMGCPIFTYGLGVWFTDLLDRFHDHLKQNFRLDQENQPFVLTPGLQGELA